MKLRDSLLEPAEQVDRAWPRGGRADPDLARELGIADSLERGHLLVTCLDERWPIAGTPPRSEEAVYPGLTPAGTASPLVAVGIVL
jgi:hypothetical protein